MASSQLELCFTAQQIQSCIDTLAREISRWWNVTEKGELLLVSPVLNGAIFFFADLVRALPFSIQITPVRARAYNLESDRLSTDGVRIELGELEPKDARILLVDDICDSGHTLSAIATELKARGAKEVKSAVLIRRRIAQARFTPDWVGFETESDGWFVGYGMDSGGALRNLPDIYTIKRD